MLTSRTAISPWLLAVPFFVDRRVAAALGEPRAIAGDLPAARAYSAVIRCLAFFAAPLALLAISARAAPTADPETLTPDLRDALHCAAVLALTSAQQQRGNLAALALPPLAERGKRYFAVIGARVMDEAGLTREAVRDLLAADAAESQRRAATEADQALPAQAQQCLVRLDTAVPPGS